MRIPLQCFGRVRKVRCSPQTNSTVLETLLLPFEDFADNLCNQ